MKKILITGANSYIGVSFENFIKKNYTEDYEIDTLDMIDAAWRKKDFSGYDVVFHVAGIAHQKETKENKPLYYKVNTDLVVETAKKAKTDGVKQFIFLSSMSVYGLIEGEITSQTQIKPNTNYGKSKYEAEQALRMLSDSKFTVTIVRPPMVYGKGCKGNFDTIIKIVKKFPIFPKVINRRSMICIDNLSEFIRVAVDQNLSGVYCPQNSKYMTTSVMATGIAEMLGKKIYLSKLLGFFVVIIKPFSPIVKKAFGDLVYKDDDEFQFNYCKVENEDSVKKSV